jgi:hypothetical protein
MVFSRARHAMSISVGLMTAMILLILHVSLPSCSAGADNATLSDNEQTKDAIVKIYTVVNKPDYFRPWNSYTRRTVDPGVS